MDNTVAQTLTLSQQKYLDGPVVSYPSAWQADVPDWIFEAIRQERLELVQEESAAGQEGHRATLAEVVAYLYPAAMEAPLNNNITNVFFYAVQQTLVRHNRAAEPLWQLLGYNREISLSGYERTQFLERLQADIRRSVIRGKSRKAKNL